MVCLRIINRMSIIVFSSSVSDKNYIIIMLTVNALSKGVAIKLNYNIV
jgi:predicted ATPase